TTYIVYSLVCAYLRKASRLFYLTELFTNLLAETRYKPYTKPLAFIGRTHSEPEKKKFGNRK
ncbi:hypothetical protein, partial [Winogradskyella bathintestinalis]